MGMGDGRSAPHMWAFCPICGAKRPICKTSNLDDLRTEVSLPRSFDTLLEESILNELIFTIFSFPQNPTDQEIWSPDC